MFGFYETPHPEPPKVIHSLNEQNKEKGLKETNYPTIQDSLKITQPKFNRGNYPKILGQSTPII